MRELICADFDLLVEPAGAGGYQARVLRAPSGEAAPVPFVLPFSELEVENFLLRIGRPRRGLDRGSRTTEAVAVRDVKSIVWYPEQAGEAAGYEAPTTQSELEALMAAIKADDTAPWCLGIESGPATGWPVTDWIEEHVLRIGGPEVYDQWVKHEIPFNAPVVDEAARLVAETLLTEGNSFGGRDYITATNFGEGRHPDVHRPTGPHAPPPGQLRHCLLAR